MQSGKQAGLKGLFSCFLVIFCILVPVFLPCQEKENLNRVFQTLNETPRNLWSDERSLLADFGGFGSSILVSNQRGGGERSYGTFVFAVPLDAQFAVDTALAMAKRLNEDTRNVTGTVNILIAFLSGEKNELPEDLGGISHKGLRDLLTLTYLPENRVLCYFDADSPPDELVLHHGIRGYVTPLKIIEPLPFLYTSKGIPWSFKIRHNTLYKLGLVEGPKALSVAWGDGVNGFVLSGKEKDKSTEKAILPENLADLILEYAGTLSFPVLNPDKGYSFFTFPYRKIFFASEWIMVTLLLVPIGIVLFLFLAYSSRYNAILIFHIRLFLKSFWVFLLLLLLLVFSFKISGSLYSLLLKIFGASSGSSNIAGLGLTMLLSVLVFSLSSFVLDIVPFPLRERFFGFSAVVLIVLGLLSAAFIDISYIPVFFWAFFFVLIGAWVSNTILIFISALLVPLFALFAILNIFQTDSGRLAELLVFSAWKMPDAWVLAFQTAMLSLPVFLLFKRGVILFRKKKFRWTPKQRPSRKYRFVFLAAMVTAVILVMVVQILKPRQQASSERRFIAEANGPDDILSFSTRDVVFQDSHIVTLELEARGSPIRFDISLVSGNEKNLLPVYSAPVPYEREDEGRRINFLLGEHPPNPLVVEIVLPLGFEGLLETSAIYNTWDSSIDPGEKPNSENYILSVSKSMNLELHGSYQENSTLIPSVEESTS